MTGELAVLLGGRQVGRVLQQGAGRLRFTYDDSWREAPGAYPLSLSMPLTAAEHGHARIAPFLWGLLPDDQAVLQGWGRRFEVSPRNAFALLTHVGEDCAGAAQFVPPERLATWEARRGRVQWLDESDVAERLRLLVTEPGAWRSPQDTGQFSLAGAQAKTALLFDRGRWGVPSGRMPTTHILKPPTSGYHGHVENEHFCLTLARELGLPAARSSVVRFGEELAIVVERYDRQRAGGEIVRVHQEDLCQALARPPDQKYEAEGGPRARDIVEVLRAHSSAREEDVDTFVDALAFNWLIGGTDAHAKNYSVLIGNEGRIRLAPLYDVASALPYRELPYQRLKLAMKVGGKYRLRDIGRRAWEKEATQLRVDQGAVVARVEALVTRLPEAVHAVAAEAERSRISHPVVSRLAKLLPARAKACAALF